MDGIDRLDAIYLFKKFRTNEKLSNRSNRSNRSIRASNRIDLEVALGEVDLGVLESGIGNFPIRIEIGDFTLFAHTKSLIR